MPVLFEKVKTVIYSKYIDAAVSEPLNLSFIGETVCPEIRTHIIARKVSVSLLCLIWIFLLSLLLFAVDATSFSRACILKTNESTIFPAS